MKKFLVITVLALFLALPVMAVTNWDFTAGGAEGSVIASLTLNGVDTNLIIASSSKAMSLTINTNGTLRTLDIVNAATSTFYIYPSAASTVNAIKIASSSASAYTSCTTFTDAIAANGGMGIRIASTTDAIATSTITLISLSNTATYNHFCGAATCDINYGLSNATADANTTCTTCPTLDGAATYNATICGAASCIANWSLSGSGASAICTPPSSIPNNGGGGGSNQPACSSVTYGAWQTACVNGWQYRGATSLNPSGCALTADQQNAQKRQCTTTTTPSGTTVTPVTTASAAQQIQTILGEAANVFSNLPGQLAAAMGVSRNEATENATVTKYTNSLVSGLKNITAAVKDAITNFVAYGTPTTKILGAGERAGVINSYKAAFGKVPATEADWADVIKIGNGRWPTARSAAAEANAKVEFKKVYKRSPVMTQANDNAAVTVIAYGLRPGNRNLNSEKAAIKSFKAIYGHAPISAIAWDIVRAIAYSGAKR